MSTAQPAVNYGTLSNLNVGGGYTALVQFDLGTLPASTTASQITKATLRLYCNRADTPGTVSVAVVGASWGEYSVTQQTAPASGAAVQAASVPAAGAFITFDVTAAVQAWVSAPATNYGFALTAGTAVLQFDSKENDETGHAPELTIALAAGATGPAGPAGPQGAAGPQGPQGAVGPQGPFGVAGPQGAAGVQGAAGSTGPQGPIGPTGATGPQGPAGNGGTFGYRGAYASTYNYAFGDVASYNGSTWISLYSNNHGNTPDQSPASWGVMAAQGSQGIQGVPGPTGQAGAAGIQGPQGVAGTPGAAGAAGTAGTPGLVYQGAYSSATNYALGDVVLWAGASYASLLAGNHGNTPGASPQQWGVLTAQGPQGLQGATGATGAAGPQGLLGPVGPPGDKGDQGNQGIAGQAGAQGIPGTTGAQGLQGPMGPQGVAGPVGLTWQGAYSSATNYALADAVSWQGAGWVSLIASNHGNTPDQSPQQWAMFAAAGGTGAQGPQGIQGPAGAAGLQGPQGVAGANGAQGPQGVAGTPGLAYRGAYASATNYALGDVVLWQGSSYASLMASNAGNTPDQSPSAWGVLASVGPAGPQGQIGNTGATGPQGIQGLAGPQGPAGTQGVAGPQGPAGPQGLTGSTGAQGAQGAQGLQGTAGQNGAQGIQGAAGTNGAQGPQGVQGAPGPQGAQGSTGATGAVGMNFRGSWLAGNTYAVNDAVAFSGSTYLALSANQNLEPDNYAQSWTVIAAAGGAGPTGSTGSAATFAVGVVTTLTAGSAATVTNTGTAQAAVLNFGIPQGATGAAGTGSGSGTGTATGSSFGATYHGVDYTHNYFSVSNTNASANADSTVLTWVPLGCTATRLDVYSLQSGNITVTLQGGTPGAMTDTALSCQPSATGATACPATGSVTVNAGSFLTLHITSASGTTAGVWTAVHCN